jgi:hypothetical protein
MPVSSVSVVLMLSFSQEERFCQCGIRIYAPVPDQEMPVRLRLEALRAAGKPGFDIAVFQRETISAKPAYPKGKGEPQPSELDVDVWVNKELIHSVLPSVEQAQEQVLTILDRRCR